LRRSAVAADSCELCGKDRKIAELWSGNNAVAHGRRGKLIGHVMPYWLVKPPTSCD